MISLCASWFSSSRCRWAFWWLFLLGSSCSSPKALFKFAPPLVEGAATAPPGYSPAKPAARSHPVFAEPTESSGPIRRMPIKQPRRRAMARRETRPWPARLAQPGFGKPIARPRIGTPLHSFRTNRLSPLPHSDSTTSPPAAANAAIPGFMKSAGLFLLGGLLIAGAGVVLGIGIGGGLGVLAALGGLVVGLLCSMVALFSATARENAARPRFTVTTLLGLLLALGGVALGAGVGGVMGLGLGMLLLGAGAVLTGVGIAIGMPDQPTAAPAPGSK